MVVFIPTSNRQTRPSEIADVDLRDEAGVGGPVATGSACSAFLILLQSFAAAQLSTVSASAVAAHGDAVKHDRRSPGSAGRGWSPPPFRRGWRAAAVCTAGTPTRHQAYLPVDGFDLADRRVRPGLADRLVGRRARSARRHRTEPVCSRSSAYLGNAHLNVILRGIGEVAQHVVDRCRRSALTTAAMSAIVTSNAW